MSGGENVYSTEVEEVLYRHPMVLEAAVFGVPDEQWGEAVYAVVVARRRRSRRTSSSRTASSTSPGYKVPKHVDAAGESVAEESGPERCSNASCASRSGRGTRRGWCERALCLGRVAAPRRFSAPLRTGSPFGRANSLRRKRRGQLVGRARCASPFHTVDPVRTARAATASLSRGVVSVER